MTCPHCKKVFNPKTQKKKPVPPLFRYRYFIGAKPGSLDNRVIVFTGDDILGMTYWSDGTWGNSGYWKLFEMDDDTCFKEVSRNAALRIAGGIP